MFKFWYRFIPEAVSVIEMGQGSVYYEKVVKPKLHSYMGSVFEEMCRYYTLDHGVRGKFGSVITEIGSWWGLELMKDESGNRYHQTADIDVVGISPIDKTAIIGECKFKNEKIDKDVYETLIRRAKLLSGNYTTTRFLLFSLSGFAKWFNQANLSDVMLITIDDMYAN